ncbi:nitroreductase family protein [Hasllibacter sp. MH4015]|uniref:nitroreductase family protein n=1 Tax=Hasllibacter sp. MH4015 TaxID=2854029 RepID=UPI001CD69AE6|nr:nitroreductase family protein [Hasllibacter sp. MH4015]
MTQPEKPSLQDLLNARFSDAPDVGDWTARTDALRAVASRGSCRSFQARAVEMDLLKVLCVTALCAPTKSDLQQRDIILVRDEAIRRQLAELVSGQAWVADAPTLAVFCGNNRRQRHIHEMHGLPFANDHLDALVNAATDAAIALGAFVAAAEAVGLGCCPISAVRNEARAVSDLLHLPAHVFPFAGLAIGYPADAPQVAKRLPLRVTCHVDRFDEGDVTGAIRAYDADRAATQPYGTQRFVGAYGESQNYGWSEDKARQYSRPERADFGAYIRAQGFKLD